MILSRGAVLTRCIMTNLNKKTVTQAIQQKRNSAGGVWAYREPYPPQPKSLQILAEAVGGIMWWWIFWHMWHDFDHIVGEFPYPDPSKWTDEELGIPPAGESPPDAEEPPSDDE